MFNNEDYWQEVKAPGTAEVILVNILEKLIKIPIDLRYTF